MSTLEKAKELMALAKKKALDDQDLPNALRYLKMSQELDDSEIIQKRIRRFEKKIAEEAESSGPESSRYETRTSTSTEEHMKEFESLEMDDGELHGDQGL